MNHSGVQLGTEKISRLFFRLAIPSVVAQLITLVYNMVDRIFIGHIPEIGSVALTGVGICMPLTIIITSFAHLIGMGGTPRISAYMGKGDEDTAEKILGTCTFALLTLTVILTTLGLVFSEHVLYFFGASENTISYALEYMHIYICGTVFVQLTTGLASFITAQGYTAMSMKIVVAGAIINIILDPIFIFLLGMNVTGAAVATIISQAVSAVWAVSFLLGKKTTLKIRRKYIRPDIKLLMPSLTLGFAPFTMHITESFIIIAFNRSLLEYGGDYAVGTMTIFYTIMQITIMPLVGFAQGAQPVTSFNYGAGNYDRVSANAKLLIKTSMIFSCVMWTAAMLFPKAFIMIFTKDPALTEYAEAFAREYFAGILILGLQFACQNTFVALQNAKRAIFLALLRKVFLLMPLIYVLPPFMADKTAAVFLAEPVADLVAGVVTGAMFFREYKGVLFFRDKDKKEEACSPGRVN